MPQYLKQLNRQWELCYQSITAAAISQHAECHDQDAGTSDSTSVHACELWYSAAETYSVRPQLYSSCVHTSQQQYSVPAAPDNGWSGPPTWGNTFRRSMFCGGWRNWAPFLLLAGSWYGLCRTKTMPSSHWQQQRAPPPPPVMKTGRPTATISSPSEKQQPLHTFTALCRVWQPIQSHMRPPRFHLDLTSCTSL